MIPASRVLDRRLMAPSIDDGRRLSSPCGVQRLIVEAARAVKVPMPIGATALESFTAARAQGEGTKDFSAMVDILCDIAQIDRPRLL